MFKKKGAIEPKLNPEIQAAEKEYRMDLAIVSWRERLKKFFYLSWIAIDSILIAIFVIYTGYYLVVGTFQDRERISGIGENTIQLQRISKERSAQPISIGGAKVFAVEDGVFDFAATINNPNQDWYAEFTYIFSSRGGDTKLYSGYIMPEEEKVIASFGFEAESNPTDAELIISDLEWNRVDAHEIEDSTAWLSEHSNFIVSDAVYSKDLEIEGGVLPRSSFSVENATPYNYWSPEFLVIIKRAGAVAGVNRTTFSGFESGEIRNVDLNWFGNAPSSGTVEIQPNINYFDEDAYMSASSELPSDAPDRRL